MSPLLPRPGSMLLGVQGGGVVLEASALAPMWQVAAALEGGRKPAVEPPTDEQGFPQTK